MPLDIWDVIDYQPSYLFDQTILTKRIFQKSPYWARRGPSPSTRQRWRTYDPHGDFPEIGRQQVGKPNLIDNSDLFVCTVANMPGVSTNVSLFTKKLNHSPWKTKDGRRKACCRTTRGWEVSESWLHKKSTLHHEKKTHPNSNYGINEIPWFFHGQVTPLRQR